MGFIDEFGAMPHEFGHILGFNHFNNTSNNSGRMMSYDSGQHLDSKHAKLLWGEHK